jgi:hypothetical protein
VPSSLCGAAAPPTLRETVTGNQRIALGLLVAALLFGLGFAAGGSLGEIALVWLVPVVLIALLFLTRRR